MSKYLAYIIKKDFAHDFDLHFYRFDPVDGILDWGETREILLDAEHQRWSRRPHISRAALAAKPIGEPVATELKKLEDGDVLIVIDGTSPEHVARATHLMQDLLDQANRVLTPTRHPAKEDACVT